MIRLDIQSDVSIPDQQLMDVRTTKNIPCDEDGEGCVYSDTTEGGTVTTTNRGRHRPDNDGTLLRLDHPRKHPSIIHGNIRVPSKSDTREEGIYWGGRFSTYSRTGNDLYLVYYKR